MSPVMLAVAASIGWGAADFFGGASRRDTPVLVIVAIAEALGLVVVAPVLVVHGTPLPGDPRLLLACLAGLGVTVELGLIYVALSRGEAFITAAVGALGAAAAVIFGLLGGDPLTAAVAAGLICALAGGALSAWTSGGSGARRALRSAGLCAGAAAGVATMLTSFHAAGRVDPYWATAAEHATTAVLAGAVALALPSSRRLPARGQLPGIALVALAGAGGDLAFAAASRAGALSIVSALSSLYPLTTAGLAVVLQGSRVGRAQAVGIALALTGAVLLGAAAS